MNTNIIKQKQYILLLSRLMCKKNVRTKTICGKTLNYYKKKGGRRFDITM